MNKSSILLLKTINKGIEDTKELKKILGLKEAQFSTIVKDLTIDEYIEKSNGLLKLKTNVKNALLRKVANQYDIVKILQESNEKVFYTITEPIKLKDIQSSTNLSLRTVQRSIADFESIGIIKKENDTICIDNTKEPLYLFAKFLKTENEKKIVEPNAEIIYQDGVRILKKVPKGETAEGELTGFSLFSDYGIEYHTTDDYYIKQKSPLKLEDVLIHAVIAAAKNNDKNALTITMLLYLKNREKMDPLEIRRTARLLGILSIWLDIEGYIRNNQSINTKLFPSRQEFEEKARLYNIERELYTLPVAYPQLFEEIGKRLSTVTNVYLFGGENMRKKGIKDRTKDCDIVVVDKKSGDNLVKSLEDMGYKSLNKSYFSEDDKRIDPFDILEHTSRSRMDLFKTRIAGKLVLSDTMMKEAEVEVFGNLRLHILRNEDIFLLKAVTLREGDIQDLRKIVQAGDFDWERVWDELNRQEHDTKINFSSTVLESLDYLYQQNSIRPPFYKKLIKRALDHEIRTIIRDNEIPLDGLIELLKGGDITEKMVRNRIDYLQKIRHLKKITIRNQVFIHAERKTTLNVYSKVPIDVNARIKQYIKKLCDYFQLPKETANKAMEIADKITETGASIGRKPSGLAAAIVYVSVVMYGDALTRKDIADVADLSQPSFDRLYGLVKSVL